MFSIVYFSLHFALQSSRNLFSCDSEKTKQQPKMQREYVCIPEVTSNNDSSFGSEGFHAIFDFKGISFTTKIVLMPSKNQRDHMNDGFGRRSFSLSAINTFRMFWFVFLSVS